MSVATLLSINKVDVAPFMHYISGSIVDSIYNNILDKLDRLKIHVWLTHWDEPLDDYRFHNSCDINIENPYYLRGGLPHHECARLSIKGNGDTAPLAFIWSPEGNSVEEGTTLESPKLWDILLKLAAEVVVENYNANDSIKTWRDIFLTAKEILH